jgi:3-phenylpropionate/trans-cinnamate dioxygenase ferredoxin reductase component
VAQLRADSVPRVRWHCRSCRTASLTRIPESVTVVGAGQAGFEMVASLRQKGFEGRILLIGDEDRLPYPRPPLSKECLRGALDPSVLRFRPDSFFESGDIELVLDDRVTSVDRRNRRVALAGGTTLGYDNLVFATGGRPRSLPIPGADFDGVLDLRTAHDAMRLHETFSVGSKVVVVGGGFIGLEVASSARVNDCAVTVIESLPRVMSRVVSPQVAAHLEREHLREGTILMLQANLKAILGSGGRVTGVELSDGKQLDADIVLVGIGLTPNDELAAGAGLATGDGILVDAYLTTDDPAISAIGDCTRFPAASGAGPIRLESVQNAVDQARCVAERLVGRATPYSSLPWFWTNQAGQKVQMVGLTATATHRVCRGDVESGSFSVFAFDESGLLGCESVNRPADYNAARAILVAGASLTPAQAQDPEFNLRTLRK